MVLNQIGGDSLVVLAQYITAIRGDNKMSLIHLAAVIHLPPPPPRTD